jgi:hypothetical protein
MARRKASNSHTTISIKWNSKEKFRTFAKLVKQTRSGEMYESDAVLFDKVLNYYIEHHEQQNTEPKGTYPTKI